MLIAEFIRELIIRPRVKHKGCLVVYDPDRRYQEICIELQSDSIKVIDATASSIESRETAWRALREISSGETSLEGFLIYLPVPRPVTDEQRQMDPFSVYEKCGSVFPQDDGEEFQSLCLRAKPDHSTAIRKLFTDNKSPSFAVVDAVGGAMSWPNLRALLKVDSARDILAGLLSPNKEQRTAIDLSDSWHQEARDFLRSSLGMQVKTRSKSWTSINAELWRFTLFSEFVFDLPSSLPESIALVPHAQQEAEPLVKDICDRLRNDIRTRSLYIEQAEEVERELSLPEICKDIDDLGRRDTFPFEERAFLQRAVRALQLEQNDLVRDICNSRVRSVWLAKGESQSQWGLVRAALALIEACDDYERQLPDNSRTQENLLDFYTGSLREADRLQREFEQGVSDTLDADGLMSGVIQQSRTRYGRLVEKIQSVFAKHLEVTGWPPAGRLTNSSVYDRFISPRISERGRRVVYIMVDALRYELGVALEKLLSDDGPVELFSACAELPTITLVGMASLLPGAATDLKLSWDKDTFIPKLAGTPVSTVAQRMDFLRKKLGDRFAEMRMNEFARKKKLELPETVDLLVLRSFEIDEHLENSPETTLRLIPETLNVIRVSLHRLKALGFHDAIIATDHGFFLNAQAEAGDVCKKPQGNWLFSTSRSMLGTGTSDVHNLVLPADKVGLRGDFANFATPRSMAPYRSGLLYFHGGASLAEAVVPILIARLDKPVQQDLRKVKVELTYKNGATRITTRLPVIDIVLLADSIFSMDGDFEILIEAQDSKGNVVGEPKPGGPVNPATSTIILSPNERLSIVMRMQMEFEGTFSVKALNPKTLSTYCTLNLETDYTV